MTDIHTDWIESVTLASQTFAGDLADADVDEVRARVDAFVASVTAPPNRIHNLVLGSFLLDAAVRISEHLHRGISSRVVCPCGQFSRKAVRSFVRWADVDSRHAFSAWCTEFFRLHHLHHPATAASRAARLMRAGSHQVWTLAALSAAVKEPPRRLARDFQRQFGVTVRTYNHLARLYAMLPKLGPHDKIDALASEAGYRSKKDFYRVLKEVLRITPARLRGSSMTERMTFERTLRLHLAGWVVGDAKDIEK